MVRTLKLWFASALLLLPPGAAGQETAEAENPTTGDRVRSLVDDTEALDGVPFREIVVASCGKRILAFRLGDPVCDHIVAAIRDAASTTIKDFNAGKMGSEAPRRINEVSRLFENALRRILDARKEFECAIPRNAEGKRQSAGYPDLILVHKPSGRVTYLDPKLFGTSQRQSSLRTFYFEPKKRTRKILHDGHHLVLGISHDGRAGKWTFLDWTLIDLHDFRVRLKAEFQASNRDLYDPKGVIESGKARPDSNDDCACQ